MRATRKSVVLSAALSVACGLWLGAGTARAQGAGNAYRGNFAGYYYSPGGYSGGYYFSPGYYPNPAPRAVAPAATYTPTRGYYGYANPGYASGFARPSRSTRTYANTTDWTTGRTNYPIPLTKPWLQPLR